MKTNIKDLQTKGFVTMAYPPQLHEAVSKTVHSWKAFTSLPQEIKKQFPYSNSGAGVGYEFKTGEGLKGDTKENMDVALYGESWLRRQAAFVENEAAVQFIEDALSVVHLIKPLILNFAEEVEKESGLTHFKDEVAESEHSYFVRFIHYFGNREEGEEIASAHPDQSAFTLHLFESDPGLECLTYQREWIPMPVGHGQTVIIPAMQMQLRSQGKLRALYHRVRATATTALTGRYSAVCFVQLKNTKKYNKEKFGRLQEKAEGFNYAMPFEEFSKLFK